MENFTMEIPTSFSRPDFINEIRADVARNNSRLQKHGLNASVYADPQKSSLLLVKKADDWMRQEYGKPQPRQLFGEFWHQGELCIMFADTNLGKSILGVQIGINLAKYSSEEPFYNQLGVPANVLYVDFEMSAKQFESRYYHTQWGSFNFGHQFFRAEFNPQADNPVLYPDYNESLAASLGAAITATKATVLIIDNLTYMRTGTERAQEALPLIKQIKALKAKHQLSVLMLAHTPKRNPANPITVNDLQGSKMLINFCDSAFAIGQSQSKPATRYLKQVKQRNARQTYGADNVCLCHIQQELNYLHFVFDGYGSEQDHLQKHDRSQQIHLASELKQGGQSIRQIGRQLGVSIGTVYNLLNQTTPVEPNTPETEPE